jgi:hypothetical protein
MICQRRCSGNPDQEGIPAFRFPFLRIHASSPGDAFWIAGERKLAALSMPRASSPWHSAQCRRKSFWPARIAFGSLSYGSSLTRQSAATSAKTEGCSQSAVRF